MENQIVKEDEIDLIELAKVIWSRRKFITKVTGVFALLGLLIAFTSKVEYEASCKLIPESSEGNVPDFGGLGSLAGLAGIDLSSFSSQSSLSPLLYPEITKSTVFINQIIEQPIYFEKLDTSISSFDYLKELDRSSLIGSVAKAVISIPKGIKSIFNKSETVEVKNIGFLRFSEEDWDIYEDFSERIQVSVDSETGIIQVRVEMPDAVASAIVADMVVKELRKKITEYKLEKVQTNFEFIEDRFNESKEDYRIKQKNLAIFTDQNRNVTTSIVQTEYERLQNELNIAFEVYKTLATQLEQTKIKIKEETPVFTVLEPVRIPEDNSKPNKILVLIILLFLGFAISVFYVILIHTLKNNGNASS